MFYELDKLLSDASVVAMHAYEDSIFLFDKNFTLYRFNEDRKLTGKQRIIANQEPLHTFNKAVSFAPHQKMLSLLYGERPLDLILDLSPTTKLLHKVTYPRKTVEATCFSPDGNYLAIGDASGRTHIVQTQSAQLVTSLRPRPDYVSCLKFSDNERFLVSAAYDNSVIVFDMVLDIEVATLKTTDIVDSISFFDDDRAFAMVQRNGAFQIFNVDERTAGSEKNLFVAWPTSSVVTADQRHLLVGMKNGSLCAVNLEKQEIVFDEPITNYAITQLSLDENVLMVSHEKSGTLLIDVNYTLEDFRNALRVKDHSNLKNMIGENIFLILEKEYDEEMIELYEPLFKKVTFLIQKGDIEAARKFVEPYENDPKIMKNFSQLVNCGENIKKLALLVKQREIVDAYNLLDKYQILNETPAAIELEYLWQGAFGKAKRLCKENDVVSFKKAETILKPFSRVPRKQEEIHALLKNIKIYIAADDLVSKKKFKEYFALVAQNPFLTKNEVHKNILEMSRNLLGKLKQSVLANDFSQAKEFVAFLAPFTNIQAEYNKLKESLVARIKFFEALRKKDINTIFALAKQNMDLRHLREYSEIEENFKRLSKQALEVAFRGRVSEIFQIFEPYKDVTLFEDKIASLVKIAYLSEMKSAAENPAVNWTKVFTTFMSLFGKSDDLLHVVSQINQVDTLKAIKSESDRYGYKKRDFVNSIMA